jgi:hypothetical protein
VAVLAIWVEGNFFATESRPLQRCGAKWAVLDVTRCVAVGAEPPIPYGLPGSTFFANDFPTAFVRFGVRVGSPHPSRVAPLPASPPSACVSLIASCRRRAAMHQPARLRLRSVDTVLMRADDMAAPATATAEPSEPVEVRPGVHAITISGTKFELSTKYRIIKPIGHGAYGVVVYVKPTRCAACASLPCARARSPPAAHRCARAYACFCVDCVAAAGSLLARTVRGGERACGGG